MKVDRFLMDVSSTFHGLVQYARILEDQVKRLTHAEALRIKRSGYADTDEWSDAWYEHRWLFEETLPRALRYSCMVSLFTALEQILKAICERLRDRSASRLSFDDLSGNILRQTFAYLEKVLAVDIPDDGFKSHLFDLYKLRNYIVHQGGRVEVSERAKLRKILNRLEGFGLSPDGYLEVKNGTCRRQLRDTEIWIVNLWKIASASVPTVAKR